MKIWLSLTCGLLTPAKDDVVDHFYAFKVKDSNDLKVKMQSFPAHPGEAGSVQEMKKNRY